MDIRLSRLCVSVLLLVGMYVSPVRAEYYNSLTGKAHHYIGLSLGGGESNNMGRGSSDRYVLTHIAGAGANVSLQYEVQYRSWIFGIGVAGQYHYLRDTLVNFIESDARIDRNGESVDYGYVYRGYRESDHVAGVSADVYVGKNIGERVYVLLGAKFSLPLWSRYTMDTRMLTQGDYAWDIEPVRSVDGNDFSVFGYYPEDSYSHTEEYEEHMRIAATGEVGANIPVRHAKSRLRAGLYATYGFRLGQSLNYPLVDYSGIDKNAATQSLADMQKNIRWHALNTSSVTYNALPQHLEVGVRLTWLFDVTIEKKTCNCMK